VTLGVAQGAEEPVAGLLQGEARAVEEVEEGIQALVDGVVAGFDQSSV
jgi:hypothetical protein